VFRFPEISDPSYRQFMTTPTEVRIAGVPWPTYKLAALAVGVLVLILVSLVATTAGPPVLAASLATTVVWVGLSPFSRSNR